MSGKHPLRATGPVLLLLVFLSGGCEIRVSCEHEPSAEELHAQGLDLMVSKQPGRAAEKFRQAAARSPADPRPRISYCQALVQSGRLERAVDACQKALKLAPENPEVLYQLAAVHVFAERFEKARPLAERAAAGDPQGARAQALLGVIELQRKGPGRAIPHLQKGARLDPHNRSTHRNLAIALALCGRCQEARQVQEQAVELGDEGRAIARAVHKHCQDAVPGQAGHKAFSIDRRAVSGREYSACVDAGACPRVPYGRYNRQTDYAGQPAMSIDYAAARAYCQQAQKRLPRVEEYRAVWKRLDWRGCCARGVIPREWTSDPGRRKNTALQARKTKKGLEIKQTRRSRGVDSSTVRCARDLPAGCAGRAP